MFQPLDLPLNLGGTNFHALEVCKRGQFFFREKRPGAGAADMHELRIIALLQNRIEFGWQQFVDDAGGMIAVAEEIGGIQNVEFTGAGIGTVVNIDRSKCHTIQQIFLAPLGAGEHLESQIASRAFGHFVEPCLGECVGIRRCVSGISGAPTVVAAAIPAAVRPNWRLVRLIVISTSCFGLIILLWENGVGNGECQFRDISDQHQDTDEHQKIGNGLAENLYDPDLSDG